MELYSSKKKLLSPERIISIKNYHQILKISPMIRMNASITIIIKQKWMKYTMIRNENNEVSLALKIELVESIMQIFKAYKLNIATLFLTINILNRLLTKVN